MVDIRHEDCMKNAKKKASSNFILCIVILSFILDMHLCYFMCNAIFYINKIVAKKI